MLVACWAEPAAAAFPGVAGRIVYSDAGYVTTLNLDSSGERELTRGRTPAWSPDGGTIAFEDHDRLYLINGDGTGKRRLPVDRGFSPAWSPDGSRLAFVDGDARIWVMNVDGTGVTRLSDGPDSAPSWSPDGSKIAFPRYHPTGGTDIWVMNADGSNPTLLLENGARNESIDWAPDGSRLVFASGTSDGTGIVAIDPDGSNPVQLTSNAYMPVYSPDGTKIAFARFQGGADGLWTIEPDGSNEVLRRQWPIYPDDWQPLHLTLGVSKREVEHRQVVTVTAHLLEDASMNDVVSIYATPHDGATTLIASGPVDAAGELSADLRRSRRTSFHATWSGDSEHPAGGLSDSRTVRVHASLRGRLDGHFSTVGKYRLYRFTNACPRRGRGCPTYVATIAPDHSGERLHFMLQLRIRGRWRTALDFGARIPPANRIVERFVYRDASIVGVPARVRTTFKGDVDHLSTRTPWAYFKVRV